MFTKLFQSTKIRRILATAVVVPALMCAAVPPSWSQSSASVQLLNNGKKKKHHNVPESGVLATVGIALAVIISAAVYRRRRVDSCDPSSV